LQLLTRLSYVLGYNHRFKRRLQRIHPNIWSFIDSIKNEVQTVHDLIAQINSGMRPREKKNQSKIVEGRIRELYSRFDNKKIAVESLLQELSFYVVHQN
jgi:hypothetical protein